MTTQDYFAYVREYQQRLADALILARAGLADPTPEEVEEMEALYTEEDPFEEQAFALQLSGEDALTALQSDEEAEADEDEDVECSCGEEVQA